MKDTDKDVVFEEFPDQEKFSKVVLAAKHRYYFYAGAIRSGKTYENIGLLSLLCRVYPKSRWAIVRKDLPTLKRTTIPTFNRIWPSSFIKKPLNKQDFNVVMQNDSEILFMPEQAAQDPELDRFKGLEVNGVFLNQIEELKEDTFNTCIQRIGQWPIEPMPPAMILADSNPTQNWVKSKVYDPWKVKKLHKDFYFQVADIFNNPYNTKEYLESLKTLPPEIYRRFVEGLWDAVDDLNQLVSWEDIQACENQVISVDKTKSLGVDVGHMGSDPTVAYLLEGPNIVDVFVYGKTKTTEVRDMVLNLALKHGIDADHICVDAVGVGAGVVDELEERGFQVIAMKGGARQIVKEQLVGTAFSFAHWKAWSYWVAAEAIKHHHVGGFKNDLLQSDARAIWYFIRGDKEIWTEGKDDLKKRIGRSCDHWDAFVYAWWAYKHRELTSFGNQFYTGSAHAAAMKEADEKLKAKVESEKSYLRMAA